MLNGEFTPSASTRRGMRSILRSKLDSGCDIFEWLKDRAEELDLTIFREMYLIDSNARGRCSATMQ